MKKLFLISLAIAFASAITGNAVAAGIMTNGEPGRLEIRLSGPNSVRVTLKPLSFTGEFSQTPAIAERQYPAPAISITDISRPLSRRVGDFNIEVRPNPLTVKVSTSRGELLQEIAFLDDGRVSFIVNDEPVLGMGEGGSRPERGVDWRTLPVEYDRRGIYDEMLPRWQADAYGSRNPVSMLIEPSKWAIYLPTPWSGVDLTAPGKGYFVLWTPGENADVAQDSNSQDGNANKGIPALSSYVPGLIDLFVFDAREAAGLMSDFSTITGKAALPPKWSLGYMQSHRTLESEEQMYDIVNTFREKKIPVDAVIYLGSGFCPQGWNYPQPSYEFDAKLIPDARSFLGNMHDLGAKVIVHVVPFGRRRLPTLHGSIPAKPGEIVDSGHIKTYWDQYHEPLMQLGVDGFWPDEGDWLNLFERIKRHQLYYEGMLSHDPDVRPWSLQRNGYPGIAQWGGWVWSGDTESSWKTLEAQIAVGLNYSMSISPFWGSDIGGFYSNPELTGELYARWVQFGAFTPSFRGHGRTWMMRLPWAWGGSYLGPLEQPGYPLERELFNKAVEPVAKQYIELRYRLLPYNYTLAWEARQTGMPMMRAMWMHYPKDETAKRLGNQYMWGENMLVAPVFVKGAESREVYLPAGQWYDWWTGELRQGNSTVTKDVDLSVMPIYVRAGAILPVDPVRQYADEKIDEPTTLRVYTGADGSFTFYDDDGISQEYLMGKGNVIAMKWDNNLNRLTLVPAAGSIPETAPRTFIVELLPGKTKKEITYSGKAVSVAF